MTRLIVNGRPLPRWLLGALAHYNLAAGAASDRATADYVGRVEKVTVTDRKIVLQFKAARGRGGSRPRGRFPAGWAATFIRFAEKLR